MPAEMETVRKNQKETLEIEATNGNEERLRWADQMDAAEERVPELEGRTIRTSQPENQRGKKAEQAPRDTYGRCSVLMPGAPKGEKERNEATFASLITENFPTMNIRRQTTNPGSSEQENTERLQPGLSDVSRSNY